ncbi:MAG TPA: Uma2 family endonuclease, partial [Urbifossiella sp.]
MPTTRTPPAAIETPDERPELFTHLDLPHTDDKPVESAYQPLQAWLLSGCLIPHLNQLHPKGDYFIGTDTGIYWKLTRPREAGCRAPDWYFIPNVPRTLDGLLRRSYVLWREIEAPQLVMEFISGDGAEER